MKYGSFKPLLIIVTLWFCFVIPSVSQDMLKALVRDHNMFRHSIGLQFADPTGINIQFFRSFLCTNHRSYATKAVIAINAGVENQFGFSKTEYTGSGTWKSGGFRFEVNYLVPILTLAPGSSTIEYYVGAGLQTGTRRFVNGDVSNPFATGGNLMGRMEYTPEGMRAGRKTFYVSFFLDYKYHRDFKSVFSYTGPSFGARMKVMH